MSCFEFRLIPRAVRRRAVQAATRLLPALLVVAPLAFPSGVSAAPAAHEIKIATLAPDGSTWMKIMRDLDTQIRTETQNAVGLRFYPGGIQGGEDVVLRKIRLGQLHGAGLTGVGLGSIAPSLRVLELPFLFRSEDEVQAVHEKLDAHFEQELREGGYELLGWSEVGFIYLYSKDPIATPAALQSAKVWLWEGDPLAEAFLKTAGVSPTPLDVTDVMTSLQTGLINAVYVSPLACIALQWFTRVKSVTDLPLTHGLGAVVITIEAWNKIPETHQPTIRRLCKAAFDRLRLATIEDNRKSAEVIKGSGVVTTSPSPTDRTRFEALGSEVETALLDKLYDRALLDQVHRELDAYRASKAAK